MQFQKVEAYIVTYMYVHVISLAKNHIYLEVLNVFEILTPLFVQHQFQSFFP